MLKFRAMKTFKSGICFAASLLVFTLAQAQSTGPNAPVKNEHGVPDAPTRLSNSATMETGTILKRDLPWRSKIPLNRTYDEMTPGQKAAFRALYETLAEEDEPPFPLNGHKPIFNAIKKGWTQLQPRGELNFAVTVGPDGKAIDVHDFGGVRGVNAAEMSSYVTTVLMDTKYKPALCKGEPCTMQFPFKLKL